MRAEQALLRVVDPGHPRDRRHDLVVLGPGVRAVARAEDVAAYDMERLAELVLHLSLPLERQVRGRHDERALHEAARLQLLEEQAGHDRLARTGIVGEQEPDARNLQEIFVDGLKLVRQRVDPRDREREVWVVFVGEAEPVSLDAEAEPQGIAVEGGVFRAHDELRHLLRVEHGLVHLVRSHAATDELQGAAHGDRGDDLDGLRKERSGDDCAGGERVERRRHGDRHELRRERDPRSRPTGRPGIATALRMASSAASFGGVVMEGGRGYAGRRRATRG